MTDLILVFDFGGTKLTAALTTTAVFEEGTGVWLAHRRLFSPSDRDARYDVETMLGLGHVLLAGARATAVGVSFGGPVDFATGMVRLSHHVPGWEDVPLRQIIASEFGATVLVDNDANVAALGAYRFGAGRGYASLLYVTVSTGVGGGWILNGRPWRGHQGMAGEIGHTIVDPQGPLCLCGKRGCVERLASGPYMAADVEDGITGKQVAEMAYHGHEKARERLLYGAWALGVGVGNAVNLVNPGLVVLGGGVSKSGDLWWSMVRRTVQKTTLPEVSVMIVPTMLGDDAPLWGAVALVEMAISER